MKTWLYKVGISLDYFLNAFAPASRAGMTISAHAGMAAYDGRWWGLFLSGFLDTVQPGHCAQAMQNDIDRAQAVIDELKPYVDHLKALAAFNP